MKLLIENWRKYLIEPTDTGDGLAREENEDTEVLRKLSQLLWHSDPGYVKQGVELARMVTPELVDKADELLFLHIRNIAKEVLEDFTSPERLKDMIAFGHNIDINELPKVISKLYEESKGINDRDSLEKWTQSMLAARKDIAERDIGPPWLVINSVFKMGEIEGDEEAVFFDTDDVYTEFLPFFIRHVIARTEGEALDRAMRSGFEAEKPYRDLSE